MYRSMNAVFAIAVAGLSSIAAAAADAQATAPDQRATRTLDTVRVTAQRLSGYDVDVAIGKSPMQIMQTPQAVMVVPEQFIREFRPIFLDDALRTVSGVNQDNTFGNTSDGFTIRGFQADKVFRNGVRTIGSRALTPSTARIEILKGPASLLYGSIEPGGLVNVATKRPYFDESLTELGYQGSDRGGNRWNFDTTGPLGEVSGLDVAYRLIADSDQSEYWRNFGEYDNTFFAPSLSLRGERLRATLAYEFYDRDDPFDRGTVVVGDRIADIPQRRRLGEEWERLTEKTNLAELDVEFDVSETTLLRLRATYQDSEGDDLQARPRRVTTDSAGNDVLVRRVDGTFGRYSDVWYYSANLLHTFGTGPLEHTVLVGVDHERGTSGRDGFVQGPDETPDEALDIFNPVFGTLDVATAAPIATGRFHGTNRTTGAYLQDTIAIGPRWHWVLGGRFEQFESYSRTIGIADPTDDSEGDTFLPRAGIVYQPRPWASLYASYSESFSPNIFSPADLAPGSPTTFDPEQGISYETGVKLEWSGLRFNAALFSIEKQNVLVIENLVPRLVDQAESEGFELDVGGDIGEATSLMASYAYIDSSDGEGHSLTNVARHTIGAALVHRWEEGILRGFSSGVSAQYVGDRDGGANPGASPGGPEFFTVPSYTLIDLFASYEWMTPLAPVRFQVNLKNASDEIYFPSSGGSLRINPGQVRTIYGSVSVAF